MAMGQAASGSGPAAAGPVPGSWADEEELAHACGSLSVSGGGASARGLTKQARATTDQCLDRRVLAILARLHQTGLLRRIHGCIATGKEANVYAATGPPPPQHGDCSADLALAVKVYKSAILVFKDRSRYVLGEHRMRGGTVRPGNNLNMVVQWAEKEFRNLLRLQRASIPCPRPIALRKNVLVMALVGDGDEAAPRLKDTVLTQTQAARVYRRLLAIMHAMFHDCRLVHADLSEYNILVRPSDMEVVVIDVSQAVEHDHPMAMEFLRLDCRNVTAFFRRRGLVVLASHVLFDFVSNATLTTADMVQDRIDALMQYDKNFEEHPNEVWAQAAIPRTLDELWDWDRDGARKEIAHSTALSDALKRMVVVNDTIGDDSTDDSSSEGDDDDEEREWVVFPPNPSKDELRAEKKLARANTKAERREARKHKMPKKVKKRATRNRQG